jgi:hypothetical protein
MQLVLVFAYAHSAGYVLLNIYCYYGADVQVANYLCKELYGLLSINTLLRA